MLVALSSSTLSFTFFTGKPCAVAGGPPLRLERRLVFNKQAKRAVIATVAPRGCRQGAPRALLEASMGETEEERLRLDEAARQEMAAKAQASLAELEEGEMAWKWKIRKRIWDYLEANDIARPPRPVHHRIPNFDGADRAAAQLAALPEFQAADIVKVNPDTPQKQVRYLTLSGGKVMLCPQPRLRTGFFSQLEAAKLPSGKVMDACSMAGVAKYGQPLGLSTKIKVDLLVIGSVAVDPSTGARLGKGEGFAELEYGMLRWMGAIDDSTLVVTSIHEAQLVDDIPVEKLRLHDVPVDIICVESPTNPRVIRTNTTIPKPKGIYWELLSPEKLAQVRVLRQLKALIERETGEKLPEGPSQPLPPTAPRKQTRMTRPSRKGRESGPRLFCWNLDFETGEEELCEHLGALTGVDVVGVKKFGGNKAHVTVKSAEDAERVIKVGHRTKLRGRSIGLKIDAPPPREAKKATARPRGQAADVGAASSSRTGDEASSAVESPDVT